MHFLYVEKQGLKMKTRITEMLKIKYPIIQGGMVHIAEPPLAAAVSNAGGLGILTGSLWTPEAYRDVFEGLS
jgi:NADH:quinone reductase (non-electrogenic)